MAKEHKRETVRLTIRSGWPDNIKSDCDHFNITYNELAYEARMSRHRIGYIAQGIANFESVAEKMIQLNVLTRAFNRIIENRNRKAVKPAWVW